MPSSFVFSKKYEVPRVLTMQQLWNLMNCHSYVKYWWYRMIYEYGYASVRADEGKDAFCPLCALPPEIYPTLVGDHGEVYENAFWTVVIDTLAEKEFRKQTLLTVLTIHEEALEGDTVKSSVYLHMMKDRLRLYRKSHFGRVYGTWFHYEGEDMDTIDPVPEHYYETLLIPDGTGDVRPPSAKGPERILQIRERALGFATRYEAGEVPE